MSFIGPLPESVHRAHTQLGCGTYQLGQGNFRPAAPDSPWTGEHRGADCIGFVLWCHRITRHRPGFNTGPWSTCVDDINTDSAIEDAQHRAELFDLVALEDVQPGDLLVYHSVLRNGHRLPMGHVGLVVDVPAGIRTVADLTIIQSHGPNGAPMAVKTDGAIWAHHDTNYPADRSVILRVKEGTR